MLASNKAQPGAGSTRAVSTGQALGFDTLNAQRDHVALQACAELTCQRSDRPRPPRPLCTAQKADAHGARFWDTVRAGPGPCSFADAAVTHFRTVHEDWRSQLPPRTKVTPRQPYLQARTVACLQLLRDWRAQVRHATTLVQVYVLQHCFSAWVSRRAPGDHAHALQALRTARLWRSSLELQVLRQAQRAHNLARKDKIAHFESLTRSAADEWHDSGKPLLAIQKLRWASRRMAERRAVYAAGGYQIEAELEDQFRAQEGGQKVTPAQLQAKLSDWLALPGSFCATALPSLLDMESACRRQAKGKAPGPDGIRNEIWRASPVAAGEWLWHLCTGIVLQGHEPAGFKNALVCALYKKGPASLPANYRSIALLNGMAKIWHSHVRRTSGQNVLRQYDDFQLGGRAGVPVAYAVAAFRNAWELSSQAGRCLSVLFVDIQAAYYEASRQLIFTGDSDLQAPAEPHSQHVAALVSQLTSSGALGILGIDAAEIALLQDCVACSHWQLAGSDNLYLASRGSRPGDGLADVLFGALFSIALRHIRRVCLDEGWGHLAAGSWVGRSDAVLSLGWADDLAILADYASPAELRATFPRVATVTLSTLRFLRFRINLGAGKTEALLDIRGPDARVIRRELLSDPSCIDLPTGDSLRVAAEYRYLGVVQSPRDTGRRDTELCAHRAQAAWAHARGICSRVPLCRGP